MYWELALGASPLQVRNGMSYTQGETPDNTITQLIAFASKKYPLLKPIIGI